MSRITLLGINDGRRVGTLTVVGAVVGPSVITLGFREEFEEVGDKVGSSVGLILLGTNV